LLRTGPARYLLPLCGIPTVVGVCPGPDGFPRLADRRSSPDLGRQRNVGELADAGEQQLQDLGLVRFMMCDDQVNREGASHHGIRDLRQAWRCRPIAGVSLGLSSTVMAHVGYARPRTM